MERYIDQNLGEVAAKVAENTERGSLLWRLLGGFLWLVLATLQLLPYILYRVITFLTITVPSWLYTAITISLTVTVNFSTLAVIAVAVLSTGSYFIRYRYLAYAKLPLEPPRKDPEVEVFPDPGGKASKPGLSNYLDEFLSAIKVFGYLERHVFHELTRTMHTRKLVAGETFVLEEEDGFCLVVEGRAQIFVKTRQTRHDQDNSAEDSDEEETGGHNQGYHLLSEVQNGAPMSSLFSILSLFTEEIELPKSSKPKVALASGPFRRRGVSRRSSRANGADVGSFMSAPRSPISRRTTLHRRGSSLDGGSPSIAAGHLATVPPLSLEEEGDTDTSDHVPAPPLKRQQSAHPDIVARAATNSTIAIIPASAFRRLTRLYPRATANVVQVILTRFYRVTLVTGHRYLGLTQEILRTEKAMNKETAAQLPDFLLGDFMENLKVKFAIEKDRIGPEEITKGIALHNPRTGGRRRSSTMKTELAASARISAAMAASERKSDRRTSSPENERTGISAGDLLGHSSKGRVSQPLQTPAPPRHRMKSPLDESYFSPTGQVQRQESLDEGELFREAALECMCHAMVLNDIHALPKPESSEQSPRLVSFDSRSKKAVFNNTLSIPDPFEAISNDGDSDSLISTALSGHGSIHASSILEDIIGEVEIVYFQQGSVLVEQDERMPGLYYVIDGFLEVSITTEAEAEQNLFGTSEVLHAESDDESPHRRRTKKPNKQALFLVKPGSLAGYLAAVTAYRSFVNIVAKSDVIVGFLPRASLERLVEKQPVILLTLAKRLTTLLDPLILHTDFALEYLQVTAGQVIYDQGDDSDSIFIILNGRLRAIQEKDKNLVVLGEYGQGDSVGELEVLTEAPRPGSLHAIRDTELAKLPKMLFNSLSQEHPGITMKMSKILARRMRSLMDSTSLEGLKERHAIGGAFNPSSIINLRTVGIVPVRSDVPVIEFASRLVNALTQIGASVVSLNQAAILNHLGRHAFSRMGKLKLSQYLADLEERYQLVLYIADTSVQSPWTSTCITQSDCILLVGVADDTPAIGEYERFLLTAKTTARKELVLLHGERLCPPGLTRKWLQNRLWINGGHHHVLMSVRTAAEPVHVPMKRFRSALKQRVQVLQAEIQKYTGRKVRQTPLYSEEAAPFKSDFHRLARRLCGKSVGLVLGGGGARGIAHVGIIRALEEAGIPIDLVGGTSIGAFVGALYAWDAGVVPMFGRIKRFAGRMGSMWRFALDLTYPSASYTTGNEFNRGIFKTFGNYLIEDFWLPFYCNTTNISKSRQEFHTSGYVWRYVRASMSLAGLLPPLCDDGSMLLDGGYIDNLTVAHMKHLGADVIFAVDVGALDDDTPQGYGDSLSGFWSLWNRFNPFSGMPNPPSLSEIQSRLAYVSSVDALERAKNTPGCHYLRPPIDSFGTLSFGEFDEIYRVGYDYGKEFLAKLRERKVLPLMAEEESEKSDLRRTRMVRRASV
jgi:lysophospholipid hydrolase